jgi:tRNA C32,U32 (ribose-2'-O)-methylase TrmJ
VFANGRLVATDTAGTVPSGLNKLDFSWAGNNNFYGNAKMVAVFKEALSDEELACLTSPNNNEIFLNYYNRMQYVNATTEAMGCAQKTYTI